MEEKTLDTLKQGIDSFFNISFYKAMSITTFIIITVMIIAGFFGFNSLPRKYKERSCMGKKWKKQFPNTSNDEIRDFLSFFAHSFTIPEKFKLKFEPDDKLLSIYEALSPPSWGVDALEFETLSLDLEEKYGIKLDIIWKDDLTLGELFRLTMPKAASTKHSCP